MKKTLVVCAIASAVLAGCSSSESSKPAAKLTPQTLTEKDFATLDVNKDGKITYDEFDLVTDNKGNASGNAVYVMIDKNGDGVISKEEFKIPASQAAAMTAPAAADQAATKESKKEEKKDAPAKK